VLIYRDSPTVVRNPHPTIGENHHIDEITMPREGLVYRVIDNLIDEMVKPTGAG
jgi:hypothetical protein